MAFNKDQMIASLFNTPTLSSIHTLADIIIIEVEVTVV